MAQPSTDAALRWLEDHVGEMIELQRELTLRPALAPENGGHGESRRADFLTEHLREHDIPVLRRWDAPDDRVPSGVRPNFAAGPAGSGPAVVVLSHLDVVPPGEPDGHGGWKGWTGDPWTLRVEGDDLVGRGVQDDQQAIVASIFALRALIETGLTPPRPVRLLMVSDEETGSRYGLRHVIETGRDFFSPDDLIVVPDAGDDDGAMIEIAEKGLLWLRLRVTGRQCHSSLPHLGINAFRVASHIVARLDELAGLFPGENPVFDVPRSTFEPTRHDANVPNINSVPGIDVFHVDCRVLPDVPLDEVVAAVRRIGDEVCARFGATLEIETVQRSDATPPTPADAPVVQALSTAIRDVLGVQPRLKGIGGGTFAAHLRRAGLPAAVWLKCTESAHQPDELCPIANLVDTARVLARLFAGD
jgi:succinyl-diaminopimelate desuccinylase